MRKIAILPLFIILMLSRTYGAQTGAGDHFDKAMSLYERHMYSPALVEFKQARAAVSAPADPMALRCDYMVAVCSSAAQEPNARALLENFLQKYPHTIYHNDVMFALSGELYKAGEWSKALPGYLSVDPSDLTAQQWSEYYFKLGHCYFQADEFGDAYTAFSRVDRNGDYGPAAIYYRSYIDYTKERYAEAKVGFQSIAANPEYAPIVPYYLLQIAFLQNEYGVVVKNGDELINKATRSRACETARIVAESWYHLGYHDQALRYMSLYRQLGGQMGREESYIDGYCRYMTGDYSAAAQSLAAACGPDDALSQNASYHLADCYLKLGDKKAAMQSFSIAATGHYDEQVREDALFNYGKLQYELGGSVFNEAINVLNRYIREYPKSARVDQAREYLLAAYYNSHDYSAAYEAIKQIQNPDNNVKAAMQKIAYFRAMERYNAGDYPGAEELLSQSASMRYNVKYNALTSFWRAELNFRKGAYGAAIPLYKDYIALSPRTEPEYAKALYAMGYCLFNQKNWDDSAAYFDRFLATNPDGEWAADTYNRQGDVKCAKRAFWQAIEMYDKAAKYNTIQQYYSQWQRAMVLGMVDRDDRKVESLKQIIAAGKGGYIDDAAYELGHTYMEQDRFVDASATLMSYLDKYPSGSRRADALSDLAMVCQNMGKSDLALQYYKQLVVAAPNSSQARDAMIGIRSIYVDKGDVDGYVSYATSTGMETDLSAVQRDSLSFAGAQRQYLVASDVKVGMNALQSYLKNFPKGAYRPNALYYLGDCAQRTNDRTLAVQSYTELSGMYPNDFTARGLEQLSRLQEDNKDYPAAMATYRKLSLSDAQPAVVSSALAGWLRTASKVPGTDMAAVADAILARPGIDKTITRQAQFAKAKALLSGPNSQNEALAIFDKLSAETQSPEGAQSAFLMVEAAYNSGNYADVKKRVFALSSQNSPQTYWVARSFLLLGDSYARQGDKFQARATYQSIVDGYSPSDDSIIDAARDGIKNLK